ncbi:XRE family transcriptional regulator [Actinomadura atramentaria]|uniref:XRE family transcriptional regulator n=1 Tax=Actinomadura atramentaria TaxID=1990 RepID=UPI0012F9ED98|nr:XRE family transcriptional regulator [Actinomadura atramentaria]
MANEAMPPGTLAQKIEWLIRNMWPDDVPRPRNNVEAAAAITNATGENMSSTTIWKLRTGRQDNPQFRTLTALASFFRVPIGYFGSPTEAEPLEEDVTFAALRRRVARGEIRHEVLRALIGLDEQTRRIVDGMILSATDNRVT